MIRVVKQFLANESGAILVTFGVMLNILILAVALTMDLGRGYMASSAIRGASDAAAVASAVEGGDDQKAQDYFTANLPNGLLGIGYDYGSDVTHSVNGSSVTVATDGFDVPAVFSAGTNLANSTVDVGGTVTVGLASGTYEPADYFFVIDSSGSMTEPSGSGTSKIEAVDIAINNFIDLVFANQFIDSNGLPAYRISLTNYRHSYHLSFPLTSDETELSSQLIDITQAGGATCGQCGFRDCKLTMIEEILRNGNTGRKQIVIFMTDGQLNMTDHLSPYPAYDPTDPPGYADPSSITDSPPIAMCDYTARGGTPTVPPPPVHDCHIAAAKECYMIKNLAIQDASGAFYDHQMKDGTIVNVTESPPVSIWTVRFGAGAASQLNDALMEYCASDPSQSLYAQTGNDLDTIFSQIGVTTGRIRITQ